MKRADSAAAARALKHWLLYGPAQLERGSESGAVAGTLDERGAAHYVYGEITGYYLHWLGGDAVDVATAVPRARAALDWIVRRYAGPALPPTRIYLASAEPDWRNRTQFCFDIAMLVGGLAKAEAKGLFDVPDTLWARLGDALSRFADADGECLVAVDRSADVTGLPRRWSTLGGPFLAKCASRILLARTRVPLAPHVSRAAHATLDTVVASAATADIGEMLHPTLYAMEGAVCAAHASLDAIHDWLQRLLALDRGKGRLPESPTSELVRTDVLAQALRLSVWIRSRRSGTTPCDRVIESLTGALLERVMPDGSIAFASGSTGANVWCAMFAQQALDWHARWRTTHAVDEIGAYDIV